MADTGAPRHHAIDHVELTVTDLADAKRFYTDAFGWEFTDYGPAYAGIRGPGGGEAGGLRLDTEPPRHGGGRPVRLPGRTALPLPRSQRQRAGGLGGVLRRGPR